MESMSSSGVVQGKNAIKLGEETVANIGHVMHVPRISKRRDPLLHQISQILNRCTYRRSHRHHLPRHHCRQVPRTYQARKCSTDGRCCGSSSGRVCVQALRVPFARGRRSSHCGSGCCIWGCAGLLLLLLLLLLRRQRRRD